MPRESGPQLVRLLRLSARVLAEQSSSPSTSAPSRPWQQLAFHACKGATRQGSFPSSITKDQHQLHGYTLRLTGSHAAPMQPQGWGSAFAVLPRGAWQRQQQALLAQPLLRSLATATGSKSGASTRLPSFSLSGALQRLRSVPIPPSVSLQLQSLWQRSRNGLLVVAALVAAYVLWRSTFRMASFFVDMTERLAEFGLLGLAVTIVALAALYLYHYFNVNPTRVYRLAMRQLSASPAVLEVLGSPLVADDVRVTVLSGGGLRFKQLRLKRTTPRVQMIYKLAGSERQGLASVEAKKKKGSYIFKLLAVDVQSAPSLSALQHTAGVQQPAEGAARIFVQGTPDYYSRSSLIWDLRKPYLKALTLQDVFEAEDEKEDEEAGRAEQRRKAQEEAQRAQAQARKAQERAEEARRAEAQNAQRRGEEARQADAQKAGPRAQEKAQAQAEVQKAGPGAQEKAQEKAQAQAEAAPGPSPSPSQLQSVQQGGRAAGAAVTAAAAGGEERLGAAAAGNKEGEGSGEKDGEGLGKSSLTLWQRWWGGGAAKAA